MNDDTKIISRAEARALGLKFFFTGRTCVHGHTLERFVSSGGCVACAKRWTAINAKTEQGRAVRKAWKEKNPERCRELGNKYEKKNRAQRGAKHKEWVLKNKERLSVYAAQYRAENIKRTLERQRIYRKKNPDVHRASIAKRRALTAGLEAAASPDIRERLRKLQKGKCACCHVSLKKVGEHLDHIMPLSKGGKHEDINLQLLCPSCNGRKYAKDPIDFAREMGRLL